MSDSFATINSNDFSHVLHSVVQWPFLSILERLGMAVAIGLFIGLEREHSRKAGVRTFALTAIAGCVGGLLGDLYAALVLGFVAIFILLTNWRQMVLQKSLALTTSAALLVVSLCAVLCGQGHIFSPAAIGVITAALLAWKKPISGFVGGLSDAEVRSAILLAILSFVVYPVLPSHAIDPWGLIEPQSNWLSVIIIAAIGFVNYILMRLLGPRGMEITAFFGGLVNSRKVIVELTNRLRESGSGLQSAVFRGVMLATAAMVLRNGLIVLLFSPQAISYCALPLVLMLITSAFLWLRRGRELNTDKPPVLSLESPFKLSAALKFGLVFLTLNVLGALAQRNFGGASFYFVSIAGGLLSSASSIASAATLIAHHELTVATGVNGIILSSLTSILINIPLIRSLAQDAIFKKIVQWALITIAFVGLIGVIVNMFFYKTF